MLETGTRAREAREGMIHKYVLMSIFMLDPIVPRDLYSRGGKYAEGRPSDKRAVTAGGSPEFMLKVKPSVF